MIDPRDDAQWRAEAADRGILMVSAAFEPEPATDRRKRG
jgi:hypothetical protein